MREFLEHCKTRLEQQDAPRVVIDFEFISNLLAWEQQMATAVESLRANQERIQRDIATLSTNFGSLSANVRKLADIVATRTISDADVTTAGRLADEIEAMNTDVQKLGAPLPVAGNITLVGSTNDFLVGSSDQLTATVTDDLGNSVPGTSVKYSSSDEAIATVDENGKVTGVAAGSAAITGTVIDAAGSAGAKASVVVNVTAAGL